MLVLLPGLDGTGILFEPLVRELPAEFQPKVVAYAGQGPNRYADLLPLVRSQLPPDTPFVLLGWSFSGPLALMAAAERPPGLLGVVLCASFIKNPLVGSPTWLTTFVHPGLLRLTPMLAQTKALLAGYSTAELQRMIREAHSQVSPEVMAERIKSVLTVDVEAELKSCPVPVLYLGASRDGVVPRRNFTMLQQARPDIRSEFIAGPHLALATNPKAAVQALVRFSRSLNTQ
ncbi:MAG: alpha/beta hydrolase [Blastocatellia bacterium]|nr:alpha/beta hydrolase [Blastocatellia bacterium]